MMTKMVKLKMMNDGKYVKQKDPENVTYLRKWGKKVWF